MKPIETLVVVGVGLIGGSFALALRQAGMVKRVVGIVKSREKGEAALAHQAVDEFTLHLSKTSGDVYFIATPVGQMEKIFSCLAPLLKEHALIMDAGSTKARVVEVARRGLGHKIGQFVPAHPIAGRELSGVEAADPALFQNQRVMLTPLAQTRPTQLALANCLWKAVGAKVSELDPIEHDQIFAQVSHLPHALAYALVWMIATQSNADGLFGYSAGGFRDFTRIAASHPIMWRDICLDNREPLLHAIDHFAAALYKMRNHIAEGDGAALENMFVAARKARQALAPQNTTAE